MNPKIALLKNQILNTERLVLRPFTVADASALLKIAQEPENTALKYKSLDDALLGLADYWMGQPLGKYAVTLAGQFIGAVELHLDAANLKAEIGYVINQDYWHHGYATEAAQALCDLCFNQLLLRRVEGMFDTRNQRSQHVLQRLGMVEEGRIVNDFIEDGVFVTTVVMAKTR